MNRIATIVKGYPRLSETFIAQEILGLEQRGVAQLIVSLRHPTEGKVHDINRAIRAEVLYLPEYLQDDLARVRAGRRKAEAMPGYGAALRLFEADLRRDPSVNRRRRWGQACVLAAELPADVDWIHTHYLHTPASVARYAAHIAGLGWSFSAHAKDIWTTAAWELKRKLADAAWGVTCTRANLDYLRSLAKEPRRIDLVYHGLDFAQFPPPRRPKPASGDFVIVSVGRAVEKKGYDDLLTALAAMRDDPRWRFEHAGGGALAKRLKAKAERLAIADRITWHGAQDRAFIFALLERADLFVLPSRLAADGDRDGLPNVLMEAQAFSVPVLATDVSGIPELVTHAKTGWLVAQRDPPALAAAMRRLLADEPLRLRLAEAGAERVRKDFAADPGIDRVAKKLRASRASKAGRHP